MAQITCSSGRVSPDPSSLTGLNKARQKHLAEYLKGEETWGKEPSREKIQHVQRPCAWSLHLWEQKERQVVRSKCKGQLEEVERVGWQHVVAG